MKMNESQDSTHQPTEQDSKSLDKTEEIGDGTIKIRKSKEQEYIRFFIEDVCADTLQLLFELNYVPKFLTHGYR